MFSQHHILLTLALGSAVLTLPDFLPTAGAQPASSNEAGSTRGPNNSTLNVIDARSMGLICDGKSDNAPVFDAIRAKAATTPGQTVHFPPATLPCLSSRPLLAVANTAYSADPGTVTLRPTPDSTASPLLFTATGVSDVTVRGLGFDGALDATGSSNNVVVVYRSARVVFDQVTVKNTAGVGIMFSSGITESGVRNAKFVNIGNRWKSTGLRRDQRQAIAFCCGTGNQNNFVVGSVFDDVGLDAISFSDQKYFLASSNRSTNVGGGYAGVLGGKLNRGVVNRDLTGGAAVYGAGSIGATVINNVTDGSGGNGIDLFKVQRVDVIGNTARRSGGNGIGFGNGSDAVITGNVVLNNNQARLKQVSAPQAGIFLTGGKFGNPPVREVTISGNSVTDDQAIKTQNYGIQLQDGSTSSGIRVDKTNQIHGNAMAEFGEGLAGYQPSAAGTP